MIAIRQSFAQGTLDYFRCPIRGCDQVKANKWAARMPKMPLRQIFSLAEVRC